LAKHYVPKRLHDNCIEETNFVHACAEVRLGILQSDISNRTHDLIRAVLFALANWTGIYLQLHLCPGQLDRDITVVLPPWPTGQGYCSCASALANWTGIFRSYSRPGQLDRDVAVVLMPWPTGQGSYGRIHALANWTGICGDVAVGVPPWPTGQGYCSKTYTHTRTGNGRPFAETFGAFIKY